MIERPKKGEGASNTPKENGRGALLMRNSRRKGGSFLGGKFVEESMGEDGVRVGGNKTGVSSTPRDEFLQGGKLDYLLEKGKYYNSWRERSSRTSAARNHVRGVGTPKGRSQGVSEVTA